MKSCGFLKSLYCQVLIAVFLAVLFGYFYPGSAIKAKPLGEGFIKLIKMTIGPLIFCTIVSGAIHNQDLKYMGRLGVKMILYFELLTSIALLIGLLVTKLIKPGLGMNIDLNSLDPAAISSYITPESHTNFTSFLLGIIPTTMTSAFSQGEILPILFISILFSVALTSLKSQTGAVVNFIEQVSHVFFKIIGFIMKLAPLGAFGSMAYTIGKYGIESLLSLLFLLLAFYVTCLAFVLLILGSVSRMCGIKISSLLRYIKEEIFLVFATSSSESALPPLIKKLEDLGCAKDIVGIVVPSGYSFNLDGSSIYFTMAIVFLAQATNTHLTIWQELYIVGILVLTSKGATTVTGGAFIALATTLSVINIIPVAGLALILGVDRFMSEGRAVTNLIGNAVATIAIAAWEKKLDKDQVKRALEPAIN